MSNETSNNNVNYMNDDLDKVVLHALNDFSKHATYANSWEQSYHNIFNCLLQRNDNNQYFNCAVISKAMEYMYNVYADCDTNTSPCYALGYLGFTRVNNIKSLLKCAKTKVKKGEDITSELLQYLVFIANTTTYNYHHTLYKTYTICLREAVIAPQRWFSNGEQWIPEVEHLFWDLHNKRDISCVGTYITSIVEQMPNSLLATLYNNSEHLVNCNNMYKMNANALDNLLCDLLLMNNKELPLLGLYHMYLQMTTSLAK